VKGLLTINPGHLGVSDKLWLLREATFESLEPQDPPYSKSIATVQQLVDLDSPSKKLNCLVDAANAIISCINEFWKNEKVVV
jgi:hypothetical protein